MKKGFVFNDVMLKSVNVLKRPEKSDLVFVSFVDMEQLEVSGDQLYFGKQEQEDLLALEGAKVNIKIRFGQMNNRSVANVVEIKPVQVPALQK